MQTRIAQYTGERMRILAAISHDLQTPITRMALRLDAMEESSQRDKLVGDLKEMHQLVREGIAYARSSHGASESAVRVDLNAFLDTLVYDYQDGGQQVTLSGLVADGALITRPRALRRILSNLIDNALKYAGAAEVDVASEAGAVLIYVRDRGPGIPESELGNVMEPFYRLEASRNRDTGGTGLGLAIAHQLADSVGGKVTLSNRPSGGLEALVRLDRNAVRLSS
jgi:signal transduction histidine kinase